MHAFVPIKCMQLSITNAGGCLKGDWWEGENLALPDLNALLFVFAMLAYCGMVQEKKEAKGNIDSCWVLSH
ncbi:MAG: hypothetical protein D3920_12790 [Candidatus Electrothrix sp. AW2]|nr:hypothetical protein [Candidatus Electrothrix gigas]